MSLALGIDVGTTFTAAAAWREGRAEVIALETHRVTVPTVVFADGDDMVFGTAAVGRGATQTAGLGREFKRRLGDPVPIMLSGAPYSADRLVALFARWVVDAVSEQVGEAPSSVVVTHPANWTEFQIHLLRNGLGQVGLGEAGLLTEPQAAAHDFGAAAHLAVGDLVLVYDLGGGTFDVALLRRDSSGFSHVGEPAGAERLGGIDFDEAVFQHVVSHLPPAITEQARADPAGRMALFQLRRACVEAKETLSSEVAVDIPVVLPGHSSTVRLTRAELEGMIRPMLGQTIDLSRQVLTAAGDAPEQLSAILLVGGSSRIPLVSELVREEMGVPVRVDAHPKLVVARGAARWAGEHPQRRAAAPITVASGHPRRRRALLVAAGAIAVAAAAGGVLYATTGGGDDNTTAETTTPTPAQRPATTAVGTAAPTSSGATTSATPPSTTVRTPVVPTLELTRFDVPKFPDTLADDGDEFWMTATGARQLARLDPETGTVRDTVDVGPDPVDVAFGEDEGLWVTLRQQGLVVRFDPDTGEVLERVEFPGRRPGSVTLGSGRVWVTVAAEESSADVVALINPDTLAVEEISFPEPGGMSLTDDELWIASKRDRQVVRIDPATMTVTGPTFPTGENPDPVVVADGVMWVGNRGNAARPGTTVLRHDMATGRMVTATVAAGPADIAVDGDRVWVISADAGTLTLIDAPTGEVLHAEEIGGRPLSILVKDGDLWIALAAANQVLRVEVS